MTDNPRPPRPRFLLILAAFYAGCLAVATYPYVASFGSALPCAGDPPQHLWIMRWYKSCLIEGKNPLVCPTLQYPVGAALGNFSPLHVPSLIFVPLSLILGDGRDALCYNVTWTAGMLLTAFGTFALGWHVLRDRSAAAMAGLLAMLSGPVMLHAHAHLELTFVGSFPLFLVAWLRLVDRPSRGRMALAAAGFVFMTACAAYFAVLAAIPAAVYGIWAAFREGRAEFRPWIRSRLAYFAGFLALMTPGVVALFAGQIWAVAHGQSMARSLVEFADHGATLWGYVLPTSYHQFYKFLPRDVWADSGYNGVRAGLIVDNASYLGIITLSLISLALIRRTKFSKAAFWWSVLAILIVLSMGAYLRVGDRSIGLPSLWLWQVASPFRMLRSPARFNLLAAVVAAVVAGAGFMQLSSSLNSRRKTALWLALAASAVLDLGMMPYALHHVAQPPAVYGAIKALKGEKSILELPLQSSSFDVTALDRTYWQSIHHLPTSAGYSGINNASYDFRVCMNTPFQTWRPDFLADPAAGAAGIVSGAGVHDFSWLYLTALNYRYLVIHRRETETLGPAASVGRLESALATARVFEDASASAFDRSKLALPTRPVALCTEGWRWSPGKSAFGASKSARLAVFNPNSDRDLMLAVEAASVREPRTVRILAGDQEVGRWRVEPGASRLYVLPRFRLPAGLQELTFSSDSESRPHAGPEAIDDARTPYSVGFSAIVFRPADSEAEPASITRKDGQGTPR